MEWKWKGPLDGGITQSLIGNFLTDPFTFVLYYGLGLEETYQLNQNLLWGNMMHKALELLLDKQDTRESLLPEIRAALVEEQKQWSYINITTLPSVMNMLLLYKEDIRFNHRFKTELQFKIPYKTKNFEVSLMGKVDGVGPNIETQKRTLVEHKCKGSYDKQLFRQEYHTDLQLNIYCFCNEVYEVIYDNIIIPETQWNAPARQMMENATGYIDRLYKTHVYGDFPINKKSFMWLDQIPITMSVDEVSHYMKTTVNPIIDAICYLYEYTQSDYFNPFNPDCYNHLFYKKPLRLFDPSRTEKFKRNYWNYLTGQIDLTSLVPTQELFKELKGEG
jgi:PD-(D/E)XK nuclease superfamily